MYYYRRLPKFDYFSPNSVDQAVGLMREHQDKVRILAGGTIVLHRMKERVAVCPYVMGLSGIKDIDTISFTEEVGVSIGAMATLADVASSPIVQTHSPLAAHVCGRVGTPHVRNMGTLVGNLSSRLTTAETVPALIALRAQISLKTISEETLLIPIEEFPTQNLDEALVTHVIIPRTGNGGIGGYEKFAMRERYDYAVASAAVMMNMDGNVCKDIRLGLGGTPLRSARSERAENLLKDESITPELIEEAAKTAVADVAMANDVMFSGEYKKRILAEMIKRAIGQALTNRIESAS